MRVCLIGSSYWSNKIKIKDTILGLKNKFGDDLVIVSGGNSFGADPIIRKYSLEMDCNYKEFNPAHTQQNLYSVMPENFFNRIYSPKNFFVRNKIMVGYSDCIILFIPKNKKTKSELNVIKCSKKMNKKIVIIE
jgi:hypothetical protein